MENIFVNQNINIILVFFEGILSFLSPCIFPLIPLYVGYLTGNAKTVQEDGSIIYKKNTVFFNTIFFILGISFAFFILGMSFSAIGEFFKDHKNIFTVFSGVFIMIMGLIQLNIIKINFLEKSRNIKNTISNPKMNVILAFVLGFTFSFAWTPCVGPSQCH